MRIQSFIKWPLCVFVYLFWIRVQFQHQQQHLSLLVEFDLSCCHETVSRTGGPSSPLKSCGYMRGLMCPRLAGRTLFEAPGVSRGRTVCKRKPHIPASSRARLNKSPPLQLHTKKKETHIQAVWNIHTGAKACFSHVCLRRFMHGK